MRLLLIIVILLVLLYSSISDNSNDNNNNDYDDEEQKLRITLDKETIEHGEISKQRAIALSNLGGYLYKKEQYITLEDISNEIVNIYESIEGRHSEKTAQVLINSALASNKNGNIDKSIAQFKCALGILVSTKGQDAKETLMLRAQMLQYNVPG
jgi:hypothetical protein